MSYMLPSKWSLALLGSLCAVLLAAGCGQREAAALDLLCQGTSPLAGEDGDLVVSTANTVLNRYATLATDAPAGNDHIHVTNVADLNDARLGPLGSGDLVLIIQMQGADINTSDSPSYGTVTNLRGAGLYELAHISSISGNRLQLQCGGLRNGYSAAGRTQVVRVPQLRNLTITAGASVVAQAWDGQRGGVVALDVESTTTIDGAIEVSGQGFRGGALDSRSDSIDLDSVLYRAGYPEGGGEKGESIAGDAAVYDTLGGRYGRGAPANGGGGGNNHNAGGGGGANGNNGMTWSGQGVMSSTVTGASAWALDPGYIANGGSLTSSSGGGRGGYSYSASNRNALSEGPGNALWNGNHRRERGGLGGRPVGNAPSTRLFLGGAGGAGDGNSGDSGPGGNGGGLVLLVSPAVGGTGQVLANGADGANTRNTHVDGAGGGGAGGTILILSNTLSGISLQAYGGRGGNQLINDLYEAEGPGGGGGGGYIAHSGSEISATAREGAGGTTTAQALTEFPSNGATSGAPGAVVSRLSGFIPLSACQLADLVVTLTATPVPARQGSPLNYTVRVSNTGLGTSSTVTTTFNLPAGSTLSSASGEGWSCSVASGVVTCSLATLSVGSAPELTITVVPTIAQGTLRASVAVASLYDPNSLNNSASVDTVVSRTNSAPVNTVPGSQSTPEDSGLLFSSSRGNPLSVSDPDAASNPLQVSLQVTNGTLTLGGTTGLSFTTGSGQADATLVFTGTLSAINAALEGLRFEPAPNFNGTAPLTLTTNDQGYSGDGGPLSDTDTVNITITPVNDPPSAADDMASVPADSINQPIDVLANDSSAPDVDESLFITAINQGVPGSSITLIDSGTRLAYTPPAGFTGTDSFTYTVSDGNGSTDSATVTVTVIKDSDKDGLNDQDEQSRGTDPNNPDSDGDDLADGLEVSLGTDPLSPDTDGGGVRDGEEVSRGTDPLVALDDAARHLLLSCGCGAASPGDSSRLSLWALLALAMLGRRSPARR